MLPAGWCPLFWSVSAGLASQPVHPSLHPPSHPRPSPAPSSAPQERVLLQPPGSQDWLEFDKGMPVGPAAVAAAFPQQARGRGAGGCCAACAAAAGPAGVCCARAALALSCKLRMPHCASSRVQAAAPAMPRDQPLGVQVTWLGGRAAVGADCLAGVLDQRPAAAEACRIVGLGSLPLDLLFRPCLLQRPATAFSHPVIQPANPINPHAPLLQVKDLLQRRIRVLVRPGEGAPPGAGEWKAGTVTGYNHGCAWLVFVCLGASWTKEGLEQAR